jgi:hypothetical protein
MSLNIKRARTTVIFYPDMSLAQDVEAAERTLAEAEATLEVAKGSTRTLASKAVSTAQDAVVAAQKALDDTRAAANATALDIVLEAVSHKRMAEAEENHPVREDDEDDAMFSVNYDTFLPELLPESVVEVKEHVSGERVSVTADEWREVCDEITDGQWRTLTLAILSLNRGSKKAPF